MKISYQWIHDYIKPGLSVEDLAACLTSTGLEVEAVNPYQSIRGGLEGVYIGKVVQCERHPDADKLTVCRVDIATGELLTIVCGAPNVAEGQKVVVATVGSTLYPYGREEGFLMKKAKIRGVSSEGMICAEDELGLGPSHDGILVLEESAPAGMPAATWFDVVTDTVFEIGLTPNRTDAMSHMGVARDLAACIAFRNGVPMPVNKPKISGLLPGNTRLPVSIIIDNQDACKRYTGITLAGVTVGPSPDWLQNRLKAIGIKPHNNVVDITNFVLHETGHPLHAFDFDKVALGTIRVGNLPEGTLFTTLDGVERKLASSDLMICDAEKPLCIAGVYGGQHSGVTAATRNLFIESAWFDPVSVRRTARHHQLNTDASFRYERGADPGITVFALARAVELICSIAGGMVASAMVDVGEYASGEFRKEIMVRYARVNELVGIALPPHQVKQILHLLEFSIIREDEMGVHVLAPSYRADVTREVDVIEEILRIYGMDNIPIPGKISVSFPPGAVKDPLSFKKMLRRYLAANGFSEAWNNSLSSSRYNELYKGKNEALEAVNLLNPLSSDLDTLRRTLLFGLLENLKHNINRKSEDIRLFEFGAAYHRISGTLATDPVKEQFVERPSLTVVMTGMRSKESWAMKQEQINFFDLKAAVHEMLNLAGFSSSQLTMEHLTDDLGGDVTSYNRKGLEIVRFGEVNSALMKQFSIRQPVYYAEFDWETLSNLYIESSFSSTDLPKFPEVRRDLSIVIDKSVTYEMIRQEVMKTDRKLIRDMNLFDVYEAGNLPEGKKSYAIGIQIRHPEKTLTEADIEEVMIKVVKNLESKTGASLR